MSLKEQYPDIGEGWSSILKQLDEVHHELVGLDSYHGIQSIERHNGMMKVQFVLEIQDTHPMHFILNSIAYRLERLTAKICEKCGRYGFRRTALTTVQTLCFDCYAIEYSDMYDNRSTQDV